MYVIVTLNSKVIVCHERLFNKKKSHLVYISRLDEEWMTDHKSAPLDKTRFLYVGRMSVEKGIFEFLKMFSQIKFDAQFSIVGNLKNQNILNKNIKIHFQ
jgi:glycosyltransferase involved in cell wall biosynthesis